MLMDMLPNLTKGDLYYFQVGRQREASFSSQLIDGAFKEQVQGL